MFGLFKKKEAGSGSVAKERLKIVLVDDRSNSSSELLEQIKNDIFQVISKYVDFDATDIDLHVEKSNTPDLKNKYVLLANIPIRKMRKH